MRLRIAAFQERIQFSNGLIQNFTSLLLVPSMLKIPNQIYPLHGETDQTKRDQLMVAREVVEMGANFMIMAAKLQKYSKAQLVDMATTLLAENRKKKLGRLPRRYRAAMICWFIRNAPTLLVPNQSPITIQTTPPPPHVDLHPTDDPKQTPNSESYFPSGSDGDDFDPDLDTDDHWYHF